MVRGYALDGRLPRGRVIWRPVGQVESEKKHGTWYLIKERSSDRHLGCDCERYRFAKKENKICKHILAFTGQGRVLNVQAFDSGGRQGAVAPTQTRIDVAGEVFTVRRGIAFDGDF